MMKSFEIIPFLNRVSELKEELESSQELNEQYIMQMNDLQELASNLRQVFQTMQQIHNYFTVITQNLKSTTENSETVVAIEKKLETVKQYIDEGLYDYTNTFNEMLRIQSESELPTIQDSYSRATVELAKKRAQNEDLEQQIETLNTEKMELTEQLTMLTEELGLNQTALAASRAKANSLQQALHLATQEVEQATQELAQSRQQLTEYSTQLAQSAQDLTQESKNTKEFEYKLEVSESETQACEQRYSALNAEYLNLQANLNTNLEEKASIEEQLNVCLVNKTELQAQLEEKERSLANERQQVASLEQQYAELQMNLGELRAQMAEATVLHDQQSKRLEEEIDRSTDDYNQLWEETNKTVAELEALNKVHDSLKQQKTSLEQQLNIKQKYLDEQSVNFNRLLESVRGSQSTTNNVLEQLQAKEAQILELKTRSTELVAALNAERAQIRDVLTPSLNASRARVTELEPNVQRVSELEEALKLCEREELRSRERANETDAKLRESLGELIEKNLELEGLRTRVAFLTPFETLYPRVEAARDGFKSQYESTDAAYRQSERELIELKARIPTLERDLKASAESVTTLGAIVTASEEKAKELAESKAKLTADYSSLLDSSIRTETELSELRDRIRGLEGDLEEVKRSYNGERLGNESLRKENTELKAENLGLQSRCSDNAIILYNAKDQILRYMNIPYGSFETKLNAQDLIGIMIRNFEEKTLETDAIKVQLDNIKATIVSQDTTKYGNISTQRLFQIYFDKCQSARQELQTIKEQLASFVTPCQVLKHETEQLTTWLTRFSELYPTIPLDSLGQMQLTSPPAAALQRMVDLVIRQIIGAASTEISVIGTSSGALMSKGVALVTDINNLVNWTKVLSSRTLQTVPVSTPQVNILKETLLKSLINFEEEIQYTQKLNDKLYVQKNRTLMFCENQIEVFYYSFLYYCVHYKLLQARTSFLNQPAYTGNQKYALHLENGKVELRQTFVLINALLLQINSIGSFLLSHKNKLPTLYRVMLSKIESGIRNLAEQVVYPASEKELLVVVNPLSSHLIANLFHVYDIHQAVLSIQMFNGPSAPETKQQERTEPMTPNFTRELLLPLQEEDSNLKKQVIAKTNLKMYKLLGKTEPIEATILYELYNRLDQLPLQVQATNEDIENVFNWLTSGLLTPLQQKLAFNELMDFLEKYTGLTPEYRTFVSAEADKVKQGLYFSDEVISQLYTLCKRAQLILTTLDNESFKEVETLLFDIGNFMNFPDFKRWMRLDVFLDPEENAVGFVYRFRFLLVATSILQHIHREVSNTKNLVSN